jgi:hypothetical protein
MGFDEKVDRAGVVQSCQDLMRFQAMFARHFAYSPSTRLGPEGEPTMLRALHRYGRYRAELIRKGLERANLPVTARTMIEHWDMADYHLLSDTGTGVIEGSDRAVTVTLSDPAEWHRWREYDAGVEIARLYYRGLLPGLAEGLGATVAFDAARLDLRRPWSVTWRVESAAESPPGPVHSGLFNRIDDAVEVARRTSMNNGALYYFGADEQTKRFDMLGEAALRQQVRDLAHERADRQKAAHLDLAVRARPPDRGHVAPGLYLVSLRRRLERVRPARAGPRLHLRLRAPPDVLPPLPPRHGRAVRGDQDARRRHLQVPDLAALEAAPGRAALPRLHRPGCLARRPTTERLGTINATSAGAAVRPARSSLAGTLDRHGRFSWDFVS